MVLIFAQIGPADLEQLAEREIDHLVVLELFLECIGADAEVAVGAREDVGFEPVQVIVQSGDNGCIRASKFGFQRRVVGIGEGLRHVMLEEADDIRKLLDGDFSEDARRVLEIGVRRGEQGGHLLFAGDERAEAVVGRREFALHQDEGRVGAGARVVVCVLLPWTDGFEREQLRANVVEHNFAVAAWN